MSQLSKCLELNIPSHLHTNGRTADNSFAESELIYRRFPEFDEFDQPNVLPDGRPSAAIFDANAMSCVRQKYISDPTDALFHNLSPKHYLDWKVASLKVEDVCKVKVENKEIAKKYSLVVEHTPNECIYPHSEVFVKDQDMVLKDEKKPKSKDVRRDIRNELRKIAEVVR